MSDPDRFESAVAEAPSAAQAASTAKAAAKLALDGDEIVQFSIKPSPWFIALVSLKWVLAMALLGAALALAIRGGWTQGVVALNVVVGVAALRVAVATLQWASKLYVLTNRRVMQFKGVLNVSVAECRLAKITAIDVDVFWYGHALRIGSIRMKPLDPGSRTLTWDDVAHPQEVHELLVRAIRKAQS